MPLPVLPAFLRHTESLSYRWLIVPLLLLYVLHLGGVGMLGPDEPRYASIGREMARSGNFITPVLDGKPWFEKPPLLYWMVALGHWVGLRGEWAPRFPIVAMSLAFLGFFYRILEREFSARLALTATAILATSAGWVTYSSLALTDLPMSAALSAAILLTLFETRSVDEKFNRGWIVGGLIGLAILGKGFVPVVLFAPLLLLARGKRLPIIAGALAVAAPWHIWCLLLNGSAFWNDYFWKQHIARFLTPDLEHVQPFWFYVPVLLAAIFPWTPVAALLAKTRLYDDVRIRVFAAWLLYGLVFFSVSRNKLPGYILPLLPVLAIVLASAIERARRTEIWLAVCAMLLTALPTIANLLPSGLLVGIRRASFSMAWGGLVFTLAAGIIWWIGREDRWDLAVLGVALATGLGMVYMKYTTYSVLDKAVSVRAFWQANKAVLDGEASQGVCLDQVRRSWEYGLNYYAARLIPQCTSEMIERKRVRDDSKELTLSVR